MTPKLLHRFTVTLVVLLLLPCAWAQQQGGQAGGGGNTGGSSRGGSQRQSQPPPPPQTQLPPILFVSGAVVSPDGGPIPSGVIIERVCNGQAKRETTVDSTGHFSFQIGGTATNRMNNLLPDASEDYATWSDQMGNETARFGGNNSGMGGASAQNLMGCEIRAALAGFRSSTVRMEGGPLTGQTDVGTIVLSPLAKAPGTTVSATNLQAPKKAKKALEDGQKEFSKKNLDAAEKHLKTATEIYPNYAAAWFGLGQIYEMEQRNQDARTAFQKSAAADTMYVSPHIHLARLAGIEGKWQEMADITDRALTLDPLDFPDGYFFNALANYNLGNMEASERSALKTQRLDGRHLLPQVHLLLANIYEKKHDPAQSMEQLRSYVKFAPASPNVDKARARLQDMELSAKNQAAAKPSGTE